VIAVPVAMVLMVRGVDMLHVMVGTGVPRYRRRSHHPSFIPLWGIALARLTARSRAVFLLRYRSDTIECTFDLGEPGCAGWR